MRGELQQQQNEFRKRQELYKLEQINYAKDQEAQRMIQNEIDRQRNEAKLQKLNDIKQWRLENAKLRAE